MKGRSFLRMMENVVTSIVPTLDQPINYVLSLNLNGDKLIKHNNQFDRIIKLVEFGNYVEQYLSMLLIQGFIDNIINNYVI